MESKVEKLVIIGSGPAGLTAAIYAARSKLSPLIIAGRTPGGQLTLTTDVDDFPGFPQGIQGRELMSLFREQAGKFGTRFIDEDVVSVNFRKPPFKLTSESREVLAQSVIVATGASAQWLGLPSEQRLIGKGVSACAICDGPFFKDKKIVVVGGGDAAMREAQHLSKFASEITIIHRRDTFRAKAVLVDLIKNRPNVKFLLNSAIEEVLGEIKVEGVRVKSTQTGKVKELLVNGVFIAIGHRPNTEFLEGHLHLDGRGYLSVKDETCTSVPGIFVAGDVADFKYRQAVTAAGAGCKAALDAEEYLERK